MITGHKILDTKTSQEGGLTKIKYWIEGHHDLSDGNTTVKYITSEITGGPETVVTITLTTAPLFEVKNGLSNLPRHGRAA